MDTSFFYFVSENRYCISDLEYCAESQRTIDMKLWDIANNRELLGHLNLVYLPGSYGNMLTYESRAELFCGYLEAFQRGNKARQMYKKAMTNPTVRLLIMNDSLFEQVAGVGCQDGKYPEPIPSVP